MSKKLLLVITLTLLLCVKTVCADDIKLEIDNIHIYDGMDSSYSNGYSPDTANGKVKIILPLLYKGTNPIVNNQITASLDLGSTTNSPFVYANYEKNVVLVDNNIEGGSTVSGYLVLFEIPLAEDRINGVYPVSVNIIYATMMPSASTTNVETDDNIITDVEQMQQSFKVYVTITDGIDPNEEPELQPEPEPEPRPQPKIILSSYKVKPSVVMAGEEFDVDITLFNTEKIWHTKNITVTYAGETNDILSNSNNNTVFINEIKDEEKVDLTLHMKARLDAKPGPQKMIINIEYEDSARVSYAVSDEILVEIKQPIRLEFDEVNIPDTVNAGDSMPITLQMFNMGKSTLYNVLCTLNMQGVIPQGSSYIGNLNSGTSAIAEIYAFFGTLDMDNNSDLDSENDDKYGISNGTITITYEDEFGEVFSKTIDVSTNIERPVFDEVSNYEEEPEEEPKKASQWWVSIIAFIGIGAILFGAISYRRKVDKLKREYGDEDI